MRLAVVALALAACVPDPVWRSGAETTLQYSALGDVAPMARDAISVINEAAGCELAVLVEPGAFVTEIVLVERHDTPRALGCAYFESAIYPAEDAADIVIESKIERMSARGANVLLVHEIGHTLGLSHSEELGFMHSPWREDGDFFDAVAVEHLRRLCEYQ